MIIIRSGALPVLPTCLDLAGGSAGAKDTQHRKVETWTPLSLLGTPSRCEPTDPEDTGNLRVYR